MSTPEREATPSQSAETSPVTVAATPIASRLPTLHELYAEYDSVWKAFIETPLEERREWSSKGYSGDSPACRLHRRLKELRDLIGPRERAFEPLLETFGERLQARDFAEDLYRALCNVDWHHEDGSRYSCSWRYAGGLVADLRGQGEDYLDFYCSGGEGRVSDDVRETLAAHGWHPVFDLD